jgi:hypothetical protein
MKPVAELKVPITPRVFPDQTFIWLPFTGGISAFAVILPKPIRSLNGLNDDLGARPVRKFHDFAENNTRPPQERKIRDNRPWK